MHKKLSNELFFTSLKQISQNFHALLNTFKGIYIHKIVFIFIVFFTHIFKEKKMFSFQSTLLFFQQAPSPNKIL